MSLVGPEPHTQKDFQKLTSEIPLYPNRLVVKPGLLNLANLQSVPSDILYGKDSSNSFAQRLEYDLRYAENLSLFLDLKVLLGSIFLPLARRRNA
jgi:putative colanic acid biosynthesis UDP-glucose lipid carrier transferase